MRVVLEILDTKENETVWHVCVQDTKTRKTRNIWLKKRSVQNLVSKQRTQGYLSPAYKISCIGPKVRLPVSEWTDEQKKIAKKLSGKQQFTDSRIISRVIFWKGFKKPTSLTIKQMEEQGLI